MLLIHGVGRARADRRDELLAAARSVCEASRSDAGCLSYGFFSDIEDPDVVVSLEVWRDESSLSAHMQHEHTTTFLAMATHLLDGPPRVTQYAIDDSPVGRPEPAPATRLHQTAKEE
jgi:quinol monooxygenase YgiN